MENSQTYSDRGLTRRIKRHILSAQHKMFAVCRPGFEHICKQELDVIVPEIEKRPVEGGIEFSASIDDLYIISLFSQTINNLYLRISRFYAHTFSLFNKEVLKIPWELYLSKDTEISCKIQASKSKLIHTGRLEDKATNAIKERLKTYPSLQCGNSRQKIHIRMIKDICYFSLAVSEGPLYKRGFKQLVNKGPLRETDAALILHAAGIIHHNILIDPMCGSGTFSLEAALIADKHPPNRLHSFQFKEWPVYNEARFKHTVKTFSQQKALLKLEIFSSDINNECVSISRQNLALSKSSHHIQLIDFFKCKEEDYPAGEKLLVINPPYGIRFKQNDICSLYKNIFNHLQYYFKNTSYAVIVPGNILKNLPLENRNSLRLVHGGVETFVLFSDKVQKLKVV